MNKTSNYNYHWEETSEKVIFYIYINNVKLFKKFRKSAKNTFNLTSKYTN